MQDPFITGHLADWDIPGKDPFKPMDRREHGPAVNCETESAGELKGRACLGIERQSLLE